MSETLLSNGGDSFGLVSGASGVSGKAGTLGCCRPARGWDGLSRVEKLVAGCVTCWALMLAVSSRIAGCDARCSAPVMGAM